MTELERKLLVIVVVLMAFAMLATPIVGTVMAGKGQEKLSFQFVVSGNKTPVPAPGYDPWFELKPKKSETWRDAERTKSWWTFAVVTVTLLIDGEPYVPDDFTFVGHNIVSADIPEFPTAVMKNEWTFTFDGIGTIIVELTGKLFNMYSPTEQYVVQRGIGWGTEQLEGVKIDLWQSGEGTIMGWDASLFD